MNRLSLAIVAVLLLDELINTFSPFSSGLGLFLFLGFFVFIRPAPVAGRPESTAIKEPGYLYGGLIVMLVIFVYSQIASFASPCQGDYVFSFSTTWVLAISWLAIEIQVPHLPKTPLIESNHALTGLVLVSLALILSAFGFDLYEFLLQDKVNRPSGLFLEPSHLALYATPLALASIGDSKTRLPGLLLTGLICVLAFSVTIALLFFLILIAFLAHKLANSGLYTNKRDILLIAIAGTVFIIIFLNYGTYNTSRIEGLLNYENTTNWSSLVYINGWMLAYSSIVHTSGLGLGLGSMGCSDFINYNNATLAQTMMPLSGGLITNLRDGSFLASKIASELGLFGIVLLSFTLFHVLKLMLPAIRGNFNLELIGVIILLLVLLFARGLPYFSAIFVYIWLFLRLTVWHRKQATG